MRKVSESIFNDGSLNGFYYGYKRLKEMWRKEMEFLFSFLDLD